MKKKTGLEFSFCFRESSKSWFDKFSFGFNAAEFAMRGCVILVQIYIWLQDAQTLFLFFCWFYTYETFGNFKVEGEYPKLISWAKRCMQKESVSETLADEREVYEAVLDYKNKFILN